MKTPKSTTPKIVRVTAFSVNGLKFNTEDEAQEHVDELVIDRVMADHTTRTMGPIYGELKIAAKDNVDFRNALIRMLDRVLKDPTIKHTDIKDAGINATINTMMGSTANRKSK
jgi:hypothetical protein